MHLPKHSNPHLIAGATRTVSRKTLRLQDDAGDSAEWSGEADEVVLAGGQEADDLHAKLDKIISKRLKLKRALAPSDEPRSSKRSKIMAEEGEERPDELQEHPEPVGEFRPSCSPQAAYQNLL